MSTVDLLLAVAEPSANFADKVLMVILGLAIVVPTLFLVGAVLISRRLELEQPEEKKEDSATSEPNKGNSPSD